MKKTLFMMAVAVLTVQALHAQTMVVSRSTDNWYLGINGGVNFQTTHINIGENLNPQGGLRIGRWVTPVLGFAIEGVASMDTKPVEDLTSTFVKHLNTSALATVNLSNWLGGYKERPRVFELTAIGGLGWGHYFGVDEELYDINNFTSKLGLDLTFNLGGNDAWQIYLEPAITYALDRSGDVRFNVNESTTSLMLGINYRFRNSTGKHYFQLVRVRDQHEIDDLNRQVNELRYAEKGFNDQLKAKDERISELEQQLEVAKNQKPTVVQQVTKVVNNNVLQPTVIFAQGKSTIDAAQMASVAMIAKYMQNHPSSIILIKGYASPEGSKEVNQRISEARAQAVKEALVNRYKVSEKRLRVQGMGATDELFDEVDFNRVATFTDTTK
jgi:outer membrane protein OmpA-like peptidoglycan-associated protein